MKCPRCGNEIRQEEAFCGQCGTPSTSPPTNLTQRVHAPSPQSGQLMPPSSFASPQNAPPLPQQFNMSNNGNASIRPFGSNQQIPFGSNQQGGFYQDATEAISSLPPGIPGPTTPPQQSFPGNPNNYPGASSFGNAPMQPHYPTNTYTNQPYMQPPAGTMGQAYFHNTAQYTPQPAPKIEQQKNTMVVIVSVCITVVLLSIIGIGGLFALRNHTNDQVTANETNTPPNAPTAAPTTTMPTPTLTISPTPDTTSTPAVSPTPDTTSTPEISPTPTTVSTPTPDPGFQWCTPACAALGYLIEYPSTWSPGATTDTQGYQYINPAAADEIVAVKVPGQTTSQPSDLLTNDLQTNFQAKPGYTAPTTVPATTTIGGTIWLTQTAYYQDAATQQQIRVMVFSTVYQQKAYIIELQANTTQFDALNQQTFNTILKSFSFQVVPTA